MCRSSAAAERRKGCCFSIAKIIRQEVQSTLLLESGLNILPKERTHTRSVWNHPTQLQKHSLFETSLQTGGHALHIYLSAQSCWNKIYECVAFFCQSQSRLLQSTCNMLRLVREENVQHIDQYSFFLMLLLCLPNRCVTKCYMLLPEPRWRRSLEAATSRMRFLPPQWLVPQQQQSKGFYKGSCISTVFLSFTLCMLCSWHAQRCIVDPLHGVRSVVLFWSPGWDDSRWIQEAFGLAGGSPAPHRSRRGTEAD